MGPCLGMRGGFWDGGGLRNAGGLIGMQGAWGMGEFGIGDLGCGGGVFGMVGEGGFWIVRLWDGGGGGLRDGGDGSKRLELWENMRRKEKVIK